MAMARRDAKPHGQNCSMNSSAGPLLVSCWAAVSATSCFTMVANMPSIHWKCSRSGTVACRSTAAWRASSSPRGCSRGKKDQVFCLHRFACLCNADWAGLGRWPIRQWRTLWPHDRCAVGDGVFHVADRCHVIESALRSRLRRLLMLIIMYVFNATRKYARGSDLCPACF